VTEKRDKVMMQLFAKGVILSFPQVWGVNVHEWSSTKLRREQLYVDSDGGVIKQVSSPLPETDCDDTSIYWGVCDPDAKWQSNVGGKEFRYFRAAMKGSQVLDLVIKNLTNYEIFQPTEPRAGITVKDCLLDIPIIVGHNTMFEIGFVLTKTDQVVGGDFLMSVLDFDNEHKDSTWQAGGQSGTKYGDHEVVTFETPISSLRKGSDVGETTKDKKYESTIRGSLADNPNGHPDHNANPNGYPLTALQMKKTMEVGYKNQQFVKVDLQHTLGDYTMRGTRHFFIGGPVLACPPGPPPPKPPTDCTDTTISWGVCDPNAKTQSNVGGKEFRYFRAGKKGSQVLDLVVKNLTNYEIFQPTDPRAGITVKDCLMDIPIIVGHNTLFEIGFVLTNTDQVVEGDWIMSVLDFDCQYKDSTWQAGGKSGTKYGDHEMVTFETKISSLRKGSEVKDLVLNKQFENIIRGNLADNPNGHPDHNANPGGYPLSALQVSKTVEVGYRNKGFVKVDLRHKLGTDTMQGTRHFFVGGPVLACPPAPPEPELQLQSAVANLVVTTPPPHTEESSMSSGSRRRS